MADLTCTITVTGVSNGRPISITETFDVEDVYDVAVLSAESAASTGIVYANDGAISLQQDAPSFVFARNASSGVTGLFKLRMDDGVNDDYALIVLCPGQFTILHEHTNGTGMVNYNATLQTTYRDVLNLLHESHPNTHGYPFGRILTANIAST